MSTAIRPVRITLGEPGLLSGAPVRLRVLRLVQPAAVRAVVCVVAAADAGEV